MFYHVVVESILRYGITVWFGNSSVQLTSQIARLIQTAMNVMGVKVMGVKVMGVRQHPSLQTIV